ncbi:MAG: glycoside hydrolase family 113 [Chthoniobacterales bacterium]
MPARWSCALQRSGSVRVLRMVAPALLALPILLAAEPFPFLKGVTVSCQTWGGEWQTPEMAQTLDELQSLGANSFAIHPYARIMNDGAVRFRTIDENRHIVVPLDWARERGMSAMVVPHLAYWGSKFSWRGEIRFETEEEWNRFFTSYETWIVEMAQIAEAHHAPLFCVGLEYTHAQKFTDRWLKIIAAVRAVYFGKLTYGGNWGDYQEVKFWDALDYVGLLAYFPLTTVADPSAAEIARGWEKRAAELERFSKRQGGKQLIFVEIGYNQNTRAAAEPWSFATGGEHAAEVQERCLDAALGLTGTQSWLAGMFLWKWFPELPHHEEEDFRLQTPELKALIARHWRTEVPNTNTQAPEKSQ